MKKSLILFSLFGLLSLVACNNKPAVEPEPEPDPIVDPYNQTYKFYLDYSHSDEPLYSLEWWRGRPLGKMPDAIKGIGDADASDPLFPHFIGWSKYSSSLDDSKLWDFAKDSADYKEVYIYGIWSD